MAALAPVKTGNIQLKLSSDGVAASVQFIDPDGKTALSPEPIIEALGKVGVTVTERIQEQITRAIEAAGECSGRMEPLIVAEGIRPTHGKDERIVWQEEWQTLCREWHEDMPPDAYPIHDVTRVETGQRFATLQPPIKPEAGTDLLGNSIPATGTCDPLVIDASIHRAEDDPCMLIAARCGQVVQRGLDVTIEPVHVVDGNVGVETGHVRTATRLWVDGRVCDHYAVQSADTITVAGAVESAGVTGERHIYVRRGIIGRRSGLVHAAQDIVAKFATEAYLRAGRDIIIGKQIMNSHLCVGRDLKAPHAGLIGGSAFVQGTLHVATVGSDADVPTHLALGVQTNTMCRLATVAKRIRAATDTLHRFQTIADALENAQDRLTDDQKLTLRSLLRKTANVKRTIAEDEKEHATLIERIFSDEPATLLVETLINPKTTLSIGDRRTSFEREVRGPVRIERRKVKNATELVLLDSKGLVIRPLPSERITAEQAAAEFHSSDFKPTAIET